ncbi:unnamed protein product [Nezara viridula]|nr:unnamed protein product [Nezara viridula]
MLTKTKELIRPQLKVTVLTETHGEGSRYALVGHFPAIWSTLKTIFFSSNFQLKFVIKYYNHHFIYPCFIWYIFFKMKFHR